MSDRGVQCKFYAHGACLKGEHCEYAHDWNTPPNNICTFYQRGACAYGTRCRYDHVKISRCYASSSSSSKIPPVVSTPTPTPTPTPLISIREVSSSPPPPPSTQQYHPIPLLLLDDPHPHPDSEQVLCSFAAAGNCPRADKCPHIHGDLCSSCGKHCLHPFNTKQRDDHFTKCHFLQKHLQTLKSSQEIECSVCLERVLSKPTPSERKFGILSQCDHPFCITCIRNWRSSSPTSGMDVNSTLRACPICRKLSYFVIPSVIWYFSTQDKEEILDSYKAKLMSIDCKYFDFGNGSCPFGTSCFYKHAYRDGRLEEVELRHLGDADGQSIIVKNIRLSDFLSDLHIS